MYSASSPIHSHNRHDEVSFMQSLSNKFTENRFVKTVSDKFAVISVPFNEVADSVEDFINEQKFGILNRKENLVRTAVKVSLVALSVVALLTIYFSPVTSLVALSLGVVAKSIHQIHTERGTNSVQTSRLRSCSDGDC